MNKERDFLIKVLEFINYYWSNGSKGWDMFQDECGIEDVSKCNRQQLRKLLKQEVNHFCDLIDKKDGIDSKDRDWLI